MPTVSHLPPQEIGLATYLEQHMVRLEGGKFMMGTSSNDREAYGDEKPRHSVTLLSFALLRYPVIQALWEAVTGENPSRFQSAFRPVENVSWHDAQEFCALLNTQLGLSAEEGYRLPTEAEWEFAARGGLRSKGALYAGSDKLKEVGWFNDNSHSETKMVCLKGPNELGLYDMSGNVGEWCQDRWHGDYKGAPKDGSAWEEGDSGYRVYRGGSGFFIPGLCRVSCRNWFDPDVRSNALGFRLALPAPPS